ncbi:MAG: peptidoglycan-binding protein, partial [Actinomycetota bacterium]|nr:peptidoglycan-binding protein [Actinomycetota bacterium]
MKTLQRTLTTLGYRTAVDGGFGAGTQRNVKRYERGRRLRTDGVVSRAQARRMRRAAARGGPG